MIADAVSAAHPDSRIEYLATREAVLARLGVLARRESIVALMGAGDIGTWGVQW
ncbi:MAG: hypothetical protein WBD02_03960 [Acidimicrobiia bacterium]